MNSLIKNLKKIYFFLILFLSFEIITSEIQIINFDGQIQYSKLSKKTSITEFKVLIKEEYSPKYIRILIEGLKKGNSKNNIISFYQQDSKFKKRTQLSQSINYESELILNKAQIKNEFYFTVECDEYPCSFIYNITEQENIELNLEERYSYTYYVTKETQEMNFVVHGKPELPQGSIMKGNNVLTIWAKGNKGIISELETTDYEKHSELNAYLVKLKNLDEFTYNFKVKGELGDLINVGVSFFDGTFHNLFYNAVDGNIKEFSGFLKKNIKEKNCFKIKKIYDKEEGFISYTNYNNFDIDLMSIVTTLIDTTDKYNDYYKRCLSLSDTDEGFYSFQYIVENNELSANIYPPQILGAEYSRLIKEGDTIQLIPIKPDYDFNYITYNVNIRHGTIINAYINSCETYPLCNASSETLNNSDKIQRYNSFSISFSKNEINQFTSSPIDKKQKILLIQCEKGARSIHEYRADDNSCLIKINMYTDKNKFYIEPYNSHYRYLPKGNEFNFIIGNKNNNIENMIFNFELFSGKVSIIPQNLNQEKYEKYIHNEKQLYIFKDKEVQINIKASENSFYHLNYIIKNNYAIDYTFTIGANYLFSLSNKLYDNLIFSESSDVYNVSNKNDIPIVIDFYPYNCIIKVHNTFDLEDETRELNEIDEFYQDISIENEKNINIVSLAKIYNYTIIKNDDNKDCLVDISYFQYNKVFFDTTYSIILSDYNPKKLKFTSEFKVIKLTYPIVNLNVNYLIKFELINPGEYTVNIFFNDEISNLSYKIKNTEEIIIRPKNFKYICKSENQICKLSFNIKSEYNDDSILKISILKEIIDKDDKKKSNTKLAIIIIISLFLIIVIILFIIYFLYIKNEDLSKNISSVSFGEQLYDNRNTESDENSLNKIL